MADSRRCEAPRCTSDASIKFHDTDLCRAHHTMAVDQLRMRRILVLEATREQVMDVLNNPLPDRRQGRRF